jgi:hypothetical protein
MSNQLCAVTGGGCRAPLTDAQIAQAAGRVDAPTSRALTDSFSSARDTVKAVPAVKEARSKAITPKLGGIVAGLL